MSWSLSCVGKPENIAAEIERYGATLSGQCALEFNDAKPHLLALVRQNFSAAGSAYERIIKLDANGSGSSRLDQTTQKVEQVERTCVVRIESLGAKFV